ncbi:hypothetical protein F5887DRAFT_1082366 [Amanita rubescens]|nr:hypothetical protein F5887DRAFT_1082366 [Amanita rubescens]
MTFKKCPHTCPHAITKTESGILWSSGGTYSTHVKSQKVHKQCSASCPAYQNPTATSPPITAEDWDEFADDTFKRYIGNPNVLRHIPIQHLGQDNQQLHPDYERFMEKRRKREERQQAGTALAMQEPLPSGSRLVQSSHQTPAPSGQQSRREKPSTQQEPLPGGSRHVNMRHQQMPSATLGQPSRREKSSGQQEPLPAGSSHRPLHSAPAGRPSRREEKPSAQQEPFQKSSHIQPQAQHVRFAHTRQATSPPPTRSPSPESGRRSISPLEYLDKHASAAERSTPRPPQVPIGSTRGGGLAVMESVGLSTSRRSQEVSRTLIPSSPARQPYPSPLPPPISQPAPPAALHLYRGAFPVQEVAMDSPFYRQPINVIVIEDRGVKSSPSTVGKDLWMIPSESYLPREWLKSVRERFPDHVFKANDKEIMSWEWLLVFYAMEKNSGGPCQMNFMTWKDYKKAVLRGKGERWEQLRTKDLVLGGLPLSLDFMDREGDGFNHDQLPAVMTNIHRLSSFTTVFPSPDQMIWHGHKLALISELSLIANDYTRTPYPRILPIRDPTEFTFQQRENLYVKREFSESSCHVLKVTPDMEFMQRFGDLVDETKELYDHDSIRNMGIQVRWFAMPYVDGLQRLGEIRLFFVGGKITHAVLTEVNEDGDITESAVEHYTPLHMIEKLYARKTKRTATDPKLSNPMASRPDVAKGHEEFMSFAMTTYQRLVEMEEKNYFGPGNSDLRVLCRFDISALLDRSGRVSYFVNEVTEPARMALFLRTAVSPLTIAMNIAIALRTKIALKRSVRAADAGHFAS